MRPRPIDKKGVLLLALVLLVPLTLAFFKCIATILILILFGAVSRFPQRFVKMAIGIEFCSLVTFCIGVVLGPIVGAIAGFFCLAISGIITIENPVDVGIAALGFILFGALAGMVPVNVHSATSLALWCAIVTVIYDLLTGIAYILFTDSTPITCARFSLMHIPANYIIINIASLKIIDLLAVC